MTMIEKITSSINRLSLIGYSETDIIKNMCPVELGLADIVCINETGDLGLEGCQKCWHQEYSSK